MECTGSGTCCYYSHVLRRWPSRFSNALIFSFPSSFSGKVQPLTIISQCGMLIESKRVRDWLNATVLRPSGRVDLYGPDAVVWQPPPSQRTSLNPMPGLVIMLLGMMMSSHHQDSMVSTMVHKQWGMLFVAFALARAVTYVLLFINPPTSLLPSRPPSEIITSFCLISGGLIFMLSVSNAQNIHAIFQNAQC